MAGLQGWYWAPAWLKAAHEPSPQFLSLMAVFLIVAQIFIL